MKQRLFLLVTMMIALAIPAFSQSTFADGPWSGSVTCQLDIDQISYKRQETQTWTLTGKKLPPNGDMRIYEATWAVTGQGEYLTQQNSQGMQVLNKWTVNVPPMLAKIRFYMDHSQTAVHITQWDTQPHADYGRATTRQVITNGVAQPSAPIPNAPIYAWDFQRITEGILSPNLSGSKSIQAAGLGAGTQPITNQVGGPTATCNWQFTKGATQANAKSDPQKCSQAAASISKTFDEMENGIAKQYDTLIAQTKDPAQAASLSNQEKSLISQLENLKQQNIKASSGNCQSGSGGTYTAQNPPGTGANSNQSSSGTGQGMNGGNSTQNPGSTNSSNSNPGQTSGTGQTQTAGGASNSPPDCSQAIAAVTQQYDTMIHEAYLEHRANNTDAEINAKYDGGAAIQAANAEWQRELATLQAQKQSAIAAAAQPCQPNSSTNTGQNSPPTGVSGSNSGQPGNTGQTQMSPNSSSQPGGVAGTFPRPDKTVALTNPNPPKKRAPTATASTNPAVAGLKNHEKQPATAAPPPPPPTSGRYLITVSGVQCIIPTLDSPTDGKGNEIYPAVYWRRYDRRTGINSMDSAEVQTQVYGDIYQAPDRIQAGSVSALGGIGPSDFIPDKVSATEKRTLAPNDGGRFPLRIWEGTLTDDADVLVISPSVWEADGSQTVTAQWLQNQSNLSDSLLQSAQLQAQISGRTLGVIDIGATQTPLAAFNLFGGGYDRPIGVVANDPTVAALPNKTLVLTREIIEAALGGPARADRFAEGAVSVSSVQTGTRQFEQQSTAPDSSAPQGSGASAGHSTPQNWKLLKIDFMDKAIGPTLGADMPGYFIMYIQIERVQPASSASQNDIMENFQKAAEQQKQMQDSLKSLTQP